MSDETKKRCVREDVCAVCSVQMRVRADELLIGRLFFFYFQSAGRFVVVFFATASTVFRAPDGSTGPTLAYSAHIAIVCPSAGIKK